MHQNQHIDSNLLTCQICQRECHSIKSLSKHVNQKHRMKSEDYHKQFINPDDSPFCPKCLEEGVEKKVHFINIIEGHAKHCRKHIYLDEERKEKIKQSFLERYGTTHPMKNPAIREKARQTTLERYGVDNVMKLEEIQRQVQETRKEKMDEISRKISQSLRTSSKVKEGREKAKQTWMERYGVDNPSKSPEVIEKIKSVLKDRYGVEWAMQSEIIRQKARRTMIERYGVEYSTQAPEVKEKIKQTCLERYGTTTTLKLPEVQEKIRRTMLEKYGVEHYSKSEEFRQFMRNHNRERFYRYFPKLLEDFELELLDEFTSATDDLRFKCKKCDHEFTDKWFYILTRINKCPNCSDYGTSGVSAFEKEVRDYCIELLGGDEMLVEYRAKPFEQNRRMEIDIFIPSKSLGIECNGLFWHSEFMNNDQFGHLRKSMMADEIGITLLHIFEDEWRFKNDIVKSMIKAKLGLIDKRIGARDCEVALIEKGQARQFLEENHIQGAGYFNAHHLGLIHKRTEELVCLLSIGKPRFNRNVEWEILRFCTKLDTVVPGGFGKLFSYFLDKYNPHSIVSYAEYRLSQRSANFYLQFGFELVSHTEPGYWYVKKGGVTRESRVKYQKHKLEGLLEFFDPKLSEHENMVLNGYTRIWDCGQLVYIWRKGD